MATLKEIRRRITSVKKTQQITKAMKMVAAAKLRKAQDNIIKARPYAYKLNDVLANVASRVNRSMHPLLDERDPEKIAYVVLTGDRGLCGGFNNNIIRKSKEIIQTEEIENYQLVTVGRRGHEHFERREYPILDRYINFFNNLEYAHAQVITDKIIDLYIKNELDRVVLIYNEFKSAVSQKIVVEQLLPVKAAEIDSKGSVDYIYEPEPVKILDTILPLHVGIQIWKVLLESYAAEQGARMTAMENATDSAQEMIENLTLHYNRARQAAITKEISEIVGGAEALK
ncbi:MAG: ATP synthase F1 subunit gamma [bacterium]|nr:ATP synthase F1 subunit gamma [bacterium]